MSKFGGIHDNHETLMSSGKNNERPFHTNIVEEPSVLNHSGGSGKDGDQGVRMHMCVCVRESMGMCVGENGYGCARM